MSASGRSLGLWEPCRLAFCAGYARRIRRLRLALPRQDTPPDDEPDIVEVDEIYTFVQKKAAAVGFMHKGSEPCKILTEHLFEVSHIARSIFARRQEKRPMSVIEFTRSLEHASCTCSLMVPRYCSDRPLQRIRNARFTKLTTPHQQVRYPDAWARTGRPSSVTETGSLRSLGRLYHARAACGGNESGVQTVQPRGQVQDDLCTNNQTGPVHWDRSAALLYDQNTF